MSITDTSLPPRQRFVPEPPNRSTVAGLDVSTLSDVAVRTRLHKGMYIGRSGEPDSALYILQRGQVLLQTRSDDGTMRALDLLGAGDLLGEGALLSGQRWQSTAIAATDGDAYVISGTAVRGLARHYPQLMNWLLEALGSRLARAERRAGIASSEHASARVLGLLEYLAERHGQPAGREVWLPLTLTQTEIGEIVGLARETVARVYAQLEGEHLIHRKGRHGLWLRTRHARCEPAAE